MKITVPIDAIPQGRPRFYNSAAVDPPKSRQFKKDLSQLVSLLRTNSAIYTGELKVELHIYRQASKFKKGVTSKRYGDIDNLVKGIFDALTGVLWQDDKQISSLYVTKNLADTPCVEIEVEEIFHNEKRTNQIPRQEH